jgi:succinate--hydroxymethylglutarate CoA-transferase
VPASPVYDVKQALESAYVAERGNVVDFAYPDGKAARMVGAPIIFSGAELPTRAAPPMGTHTVEQLRAAGYSEKRIDELRVAGVI